MPSLYISPKEFEHLKMEINLAFEIAHKKIDLLQERVVELEEDLKSVQAEKTAKEKATKTKS